MYHLTYGLCTHTVGTHGLCHTITARATVWSCASVSLSISKEKHVSIIDQSVALIDYKYTQTSSGSAAVVLTYGQWSVHPSTPYLDLYFWDSNSYIYTRGNLRYSESFHTDVDANHWHNTLQLICGIQLGTDNNITMQLLGDIYNDQFTKSTPLEICTPLTDNKWKSEMSNKINTQFIQSSDHVSFHIKWPSPFRSIIDFSQHSMIQVFSNHENTAGSKTLH